MDSETFYAVVRREIGPRLAPCGFRLSSRDAPPAPLRLVVSFAHWKWGWLPTVGGAFRLWLEAGATAGAWELLDDDQSRQVKDLQRRVVQKVIRESRVWGPRPDLEAYDEVTSFVPYWNEDDLMAWLTLLKPWIPDLAAKLGRRASIASEFILSNPPRRG